MAARRRARADNPPAAPVAPPSPDPPSAGEIASAAVLEYWGGNSSPSIEAFSTVAAKLRECSRAELTLIEVSIPATTGHTEMLCKRMRDLVTGLKAEG